MKRHLLLIFPLILLVSCASVPPPPPPWAATLNGVATTYPNAQYIAQRGRGPDLISAQNDGVAQISRWITSQIETSQSSQLSIIERNNISDESRQTSEATFVNSQTNLFAVRYAPDPWYNAAEKQWETVAYIDRDETWTIYEPQVRQRADAFTKLYNAAEAEAEPFRKFFQYQRTQAYAEQELDSYFRFAEILNPRGARSFSDVNDLISAIPQAIDQSRASASIFVDCPVDYNGMTATALTQVLSDEGFPVARSQSVASAVCTASVDEGLQTLSAGTFYTPAVRISITGKSGSPLFSCTIRVQERVGAVTPDVAKNRGYTALAGEIRKSFHGELIANSGN
jgi:hypothetical protein